MVALSKRYFWIYLATVILTVVSRLSFIIVILIESLFSPDPHLLRCLCILEWLYSWLCVWTEVDAAVIAPCSCLLTEHIYHWFQIMYGSMFWLSNSTSRHCSASAMCSFRKQEAPFRHQGANFSREDAIFRRQDAAFKREEATRVVANWEFSICICYNINQEAWRRITCR